MLVFILSFLSQEYTESEHYFCIYSFMHTAYIPQDSNNSNYIHFKFKLNSFCTIFSSHHIKVFISLYKWWGEIQRFRVFSIATFCSVHLYSQQSNSSIIWSILRVRHSQKALKRLRVKNCFERFFFIQKFCVLQQKQYKWIDFNQWNFVFKIVLLFQINWKKVFTFSKKSGIR